MIAECPNPDHAGSHVVRHGFSGSPPRQRYRCEPAVASAHTFSAPIATASPSTEEPVAAEMIRSYRHDVYEIALALVALGRGASYRQAALNSSAGSNANGQLIANWVRAFGPVVTGADLPRRWPHVVAVGTLTLQPRLGVDSLVVQLAVGPATPAAAPQLWEARIASQRPDEWPKFYERHAGAPEVLVTRRGSAAAAAALAVWATKPPTLIESRRWMRPAIESHGSPAAALDDGSAAAIDVDVLVRAYADARETLLRRLAQRRGHFRRADQLDLLLDLMRMDIIGEAEPAEYARRITFGQAY